MTSSVRDLLFLALFSCLAQPLYGQSRGQRIKVRWCTGGYQAYYSCQHLIKEMQEELSGPATVPVTVDSGTADGKIRYDAELVCVFAQHDFECADFIRTGKADVARLMAEELYGLSTSSIYNDLVVTVAGLTDQHECLPFSDCHRYVREYSVAVVRRTSNIKGPFDLRDKRACFGNVSATPGRLNTAGWIIPVSHLVSNWRSRWSKQQLQQLTPTSASAVSMSNAGRGQKHRNESAIKLAPVPLTCAIDLNVVKDTFPASCAPGLWASDEIFGPLFRDHLCKLCVDRTGVGCSPNVHANDPFECLKSASGGDVAFVSSDEIDRRLKSRPPTLAFHEFGTLCAQVEGLDRYRECHWGIVPEDAYVVAGHRRDSPGLERERGVRFYGEFIRRLHMYAKAQNLDEFSRLFIADPSVVEVRSVANRTWSPTPLDYLRQEGGRSFLNAMNASVAPTSECANKNRMRLCVLSDAEKQKCHEMQLAFGAAALPSPSLECVVGYSRSKCLDLLKKGDADIAVLSAHRADDYVRADRARPLMRETYHHGARRPVAVAVMFGRHAKISGLKHLLNTDPERQLARVCSSGTDSFAGWEAPNSAFKRLGLLPLQECRLTEAWSERLRPSCVPGARSVDATLGRSAVYPINQEKANRLCDGCGSTSVGTCKTPTEAEDPQHNLFDTYYGDIGALRCVLRKRGDVAFVRSTALETLRLLKEANVQDFRNVDLNEIYLLCGDGEKYEKFSLEALERCNLGRIPDRWMVARPDADIQQLSRWQDFWVLAQERARAHFDWLRTYIAFNETDRDSHFLDLIFINATTKLERFDLRNHPEQIWKTLTYDDKGFVDPFPTECRGISGGGSSAFSTLYVAFRLLTLVLVFLITFMLAA